MNTGEISHRNLTLSITLAFFLAASGCIKDVGEPPTTFDLKGDVLALVSPDTVQAGQSFRVQISFPTICGGNFTRFTRSDSGNMVTLSPIIHVVPQEECTGGGYIETETTSVNLSASGTYQLIANGRYGKLTKTIQIVSTPVTHQGYILHYLFVDGYRAPKPNQAAYFLFPDRTPTSTIVIQSDSNGIWETTFNDTLHRVRYIIGDVTFEAFEGIKEDGMILYP